MNRSGEFAADFLQVRQAARYHHQGDLEVLQRSDPVLFDHVIGITLNELNCYGRYFNSGQGTRMIPADVRQQTVWSRCVFFVLALGGRRY